MQTKEFITLARGYKGMWKASPASSIIFHTFFHTVLLPISLPFYMINMLESEDNEMIF